MTAEPCRKWRELLGVHALGQLSGDERAALEAHLEGCPDCRAELDSLAEVAELMPLADPERLESTPAPPFDLADRVVGAVQGEQRAKRRRRLRLGFATGAATAAVAAALLAIFVLPGGEPDSGQRVAFGPLPGGLEISARLEPRSFGTEVHVYVKGARPGTLCRVFVRSQGGTRLPAGSFRYRRTEDSGATLSSALSLAQTHALGVRVGNRTFVAPVPAPT